MIEFVLQHQFWTAVAVYWGFSAAVWTMSEPNVRGRRLLHATAGNISTDLGCRIQGFKIVGPLLLPPLFLVTAACAGRYYVHPGALNLSDLATVDASRATISSSSRSRRLSGVYNSRLQMNPLLASLQPYPFERLKQLFASVTPNPAYRPISLGIGEPRHATPQLVLDALAGATRELAMYPPTAGSPALRQACAGWVQRRYGVTLDPARADPAGQWFARSAVRLRPDRGRRKRRQCDRDLPEPVLSNLRRRRFAGGRKAVLRAERSGSKLQHQLGRHSRRRVGRARSWCMSARRAIPPAP